MSDHDTSDGCGPAHKDFGQKLERLDQQIIMIKAERTKFLKSVWEICDGFPKIARRGPMLPIWRRELYLVLGFLISWHGKGLVTRLIKTNGTLGGALIEAVPSWRDSDEGPLVDLTANEVDVLTREHSNRAWSKYFLTEVSL